MEENKNMKFYEELRKAPEEALKTIQAGRLKGMSDVNPMWRIKVMTQAFGVCGFGWKYEITNQWTEAYGNEVKVFTNINLYINVDGEWSEPIPGTGGSSVVAAEHSGLYVSDEAYKMALTDALSVAMKALGVAADVYFRADAKYDTKYSQDEYVAQAKNETKKVEKKVEDKVEKKVEYDDNLKKLISECTSSEAVGAIWNAYPYLRTNQEFKSQIIAKGSELKAQEGAA